MNDSTSDLTDEQLATAANEAWDKANMCLGGGLPDRRVAALRAVAALARQGWAPVGTGPSLEDLGPLIAWLGEAAIQAANAGRSDDAGMLAWALEVVGERVDEDAPDHIADGSNMVAPPALPSDIEQALIDAECALGDTAEGAPLEWAEQQAAKALAQIRRVMRRFSVETSEWPPAPAAMPPPAGEG